MIRPRACWGAACDLLGMSVVYPAGGAVTISKKFLLIRILSKRTDCIDCGDFVNGRGKGPLVKGGCPRERTGGFRRAAREDGAARMRPGIPPASQARPPVPPLALRATSPVPGESVPWGKAFLFQICCSSFNPSLTPASSASTSRMPLPAKPPRTAQGQAEVSWQR